MKTLDNISTQQGLQNERLISLLNRIEEGNITNSSLISELKSHISLDIKLTDKLNETLNK